jgi:hypothetical protein
MVPFTLVTLLSQQLPWLEIHGHSGWFCMFTFVLVLFINFLPNYSKRIKLVVLVLLILYISHDLVHWTPNLHPNY